MDNTLNISIKSLFCNHCELDCETIEKMKEHYKSDYHRYNLNRISMGLNSVNIDVFMKKKEYCILFVKKMKK
jgi:hypothetical protein